VTAFYLVRFSLEIQVAFTMEERIKKMDFVQYTNKNNLLVNL